MPTLTLATWNVNGIRARESHVNDLARHDIARRRLPAGNQGHAGAGAGVAPHPRLVVLARCRRLLGRRAAREEVAQPGVPMVHTGVRLRATNRNRRSRRHHHRLGVRAQRRQGPRRQDALPHRPARVRRRTSRRRRGDRVVRRHERRTRGSRRAPQGTETRRDRPDGARARAVRHAARDGAHRLGRALTPTPRIFFTWWAPWRNLRQRNMGGGSTTSSPAAPSTPGSLRRNHSARSARATMRRWCCGWSRDRFLAGSDPGGAWGGARGELGGAAAVVRSCCFLSVPQR